MTIDFYLLDIVVLSFPGSAEREILAKGYSPTVSRKYFPFLNGGHDLLLRGAPQQKLLEGVVGK